MGPSGQGLKCSGLEPAPASPQQVIALSPGQVPKESVPKESFPTPNISPSHGHPPVSVTQVSGEGIAVRKSLRASTSYLHPRPSTPQTSSSCRSPSSCKTCFRALATTCFLLLRKSLSSTLRSKPRRTASSSGLGRYRSQGSGGTCIAQPLVGEAHSDCRINSLLPTPKAILYTTLPDSCDYPGLPRM